LPTAGGRITVAIANSPSFGSTRSPVAGSVPVIAM
jgi:hypothetical protein